MSEKSQKDVPAPDDRVNEAGLCFQEAYYDG
jgi:hypothetical protein